MVCPCLVSDIKHFIKSKKWYEIETGILVSTEHLRMHMKHLHAAYLKFVISSWYTQNQLTLYFEASILFLGHLNTLRPRQNGCRFADIFKRIFFNENVWISIKISLKFVPINMLVGSLTHICVTRPHWVNSTFLRDCMLLFFFDVGITWHIWRVRHRRDWTLTNELSGFSLDVFCKLGAIYYLQKCMDLKVPVLLNSISICTLNICWGNIHLTSRDTFDMPMWQGKCLFWFWSLQLTNGVHIWSENPP